MRATALDLRDAQGEELANVLDWWGLFHRDPAILGTKTGRLQVTYAAVCPDTEQMAPEPRAWYLARLDEVLKVLDPEWTLDADWWHEPTTVYPVTDWAARGVPRTHALVDALRQDECVTRPRHASQLYLTLSWAPPPPARALLEDVLVTRGASRRVQRTLEDEIARFHEAHHRFVTLLAPLLDGLVPLNADQLCTYLHQLVSWDRHPIACPALPYDLDWQLSSDLWLPGQPPLLGNQLVQPITIKTWHPHLRTWLPEALSKLPFPCRYHVRWAPLSPGAATTFLTWAEKKWSAGYRGVGKLLKTSAGVDEATEVQGRGEQEGAIAAGQSIIDLRKAVMQGKQVVGGLQPTIVCWGATYEALGARVKQVTEALFTQGLVARVEKAHASFAWLATLAGHVRYNLRAVCLATEHLTAVIPHSQMWSGPPVGAAPFDAPLLVCSTDGALFSVVTHHGELRHVLLIGPSRSGKSGTLGLMISQSFRYAHARACLFDRDYALKAVTLLHGGRHYDLGQPGGDRIQLLGDLETEADRQWAALELEELLTGEGLPPDPDERREIQRTVALLADLPRAQRTMSMAREQLQVTRLKVGLAPFCVGGEYAFCDGNAEAFQWDARLLCFEMSHLLAQPRALRVVLSYCFHQLETRWFVGDPVTIVVDELKWLLLIARFLGEFEVWLKARAKKNVGVWMSTQEVYDIQTTTIWQGVLASVPTKLLFPNPDALSPAVRPLYQDLNVSDAALQQLVMGQPRRDCLYQSPWGWRLYQNTLSPVERLLCAASRLEELAVLDMLAAQVPPDELPSAWLRHWGYNDEAALLDSPALSLEGDLCSAPSSPSSPV